MRIHLPLTTHQPANDNTGPHHPTPAYQASAEPMCRPDHKAKKHSRPHKWEERAARRERQVREWGL